MFTPVDDSRVVLNEIEGEEGSDYINASYIQVSTCTYIVFRQTNYKPLQIASLSEFMS